MGNFLSQSRQAPSEAELQGVLEEVFQEIGVPGLELRASASGLTPDLDGSLDATCGGYRSSYAYEYRTSSTPQVVERAMVQAQRYTRGLCVRPLVIVPYLSEPRLKELAAQDVSGLDLCGNCALISDRFYIWRSGNANRFSESRPIKNVFRGSSSIFSRCFVLRPSFLSLMALQEFARARVGTDRGPEGGGAYLTKGTASKVVRELEAHLLIVREQKMLRVLDMERLMDALLREYRPSQGRRLAGKAGNVTAMFEARSSVRGLRAVVTGACSGSHYGVLSGPDMLSVYVSDLDAAVRMSGLKDTHVFPNLELIEERSDVVYFDGRQDEGRLWASPVQTWLELAGGGPRERVGAEVLALALRTGHVGDE